MADRLSIRAYAQHRGAVGLPGRNHNAVRKAIGSGRIAQAVGDDGLIDVALADRLWSERTSGGPPPAAASSASNGGIRTADVAPVDSGPHALFVTSRAKLTAAKAAQAELDLAERLKTLIPVDVHERRCAAFAAEANAALQSLSARWSAQLIGITSVAEMQRKVGELANEIVEELASGPAAS